jgi:hypothetical protein
VIRPGRLPDEAGAVDAVGALVGDVDGVGEGVSVEV